MRVIVLDDFRFIVPEDSDNRKRGVGNIADLADRQRRGNGRYAVLDAHTAGDHRGDDFRRERGKDVGLHPAAEAVGQHNDLVVLVRGDALHAVAAERLAVFVQAVVADVAEQVIHRSATP